MPVPRFDSVDTFSFALLIFRFDFFRFALRFHFGRSGVVADACVIRCRGSRCVANIFFVVVVGSSRPSFNRVLAMNGVALASILFFFIALARVDITQFVWCVSVCFV